MFQNFIKSPGGILVICLAAFLIFSGWFGYSFSTINMGFEGPVCHFYGADFRFSPEWEGTNELRKYQDAEDMLCHNDAYGYWDKISWVSTATPNDVAIKWEYKTPITSMSQRPDLRIHVETRPKMKAINRQGDPLGWNETNPMDSRRIEYWDFSEPVATEHEDKTIYHWECTKETFIIAPVEFWVGFSLIPSQSNTGGTASGWREGEWQSIQTWYRLDFNIWENAYKDAWLDDPEINVFNTSSEGRLLNKEKTWDYRGGFPIAGWIQGWEKAGMTSNIKAGKQFSEIWYKVATGDIEQDFTIDQKFDLQRKLMAKCSFSPSLEGQMITLYDAPDPKYTYEVPGEFSNEDATTEVAASRVKSPDPSMKEVMYFPINIVNFGTYADGSFMHDWNVYYPSAYFRVRMIYGVYGTFKYLWTEEVTKPFEEGGLDYTDEIGRHGTTVIHKEGFLSTWGLPLTIIGFIALAVIGLIVISVVFGGAGIGILTSRFFQCYRRETKRKGIMIGFRSRAR